MILCFATLLLGTMVNASSHSSQPLALKPPGRLWASGIWSALTRCWKQPTAGFLVESALLPDGRLTYGHKCTHTTIPWSCEVNFRTPRDEPCKEMRIEKRSIRLTVAVQKLQALLPGPFLSDWTFSTSLQLSRNCYTMLSLTTYFLFIQCLQNICRAEVPTYLKKPPRDTSPPSFSARGMRLLCFSRLEPGDLRLTQPQQDIRAPRDVSDCKNPLRKP